MTRAAGSKRGWLAFLLSFLNPGFGHLYAGQLWRAGAALVFTFGIALPALVLVPMYVSWSMPACLAGYLMAVLILLIVPIDAARSARVIPTVEGLPRVRWFHYAGFLIVSVILVQVIQAWLLPVLPRRRSWVPTAAMAPAILAGDTILTDRGPQACSHLAIGDIVVFETPEQPGKEFVKRLAGLPGNVVQVRDGLLYIDGTLRSAGNDQPDHPEYKRETLGTHTYEIQVPPVVEIPCGDWGPDRVPEGKFFLLGDNRCESRDSRYYGYIAREHLLARTIGVHWSWNREARAVRWERLGMSLLER